MLGAAVLLLIIVVIASLPGDDPAAAAPPPPAPAAVRGPAIAPSLPPPAPATGTPPPPTPEVRPPPPPVAPVALPCATQPCGHGSCTDDTDSTYSCDCGDGGTGDHCDQEVVCTPSFREGNTHDVTQLFTNGQDVHNSIDCEEGYQMFRFHAQERTTYQLQVELSTSKSAHKQPPRFVVI